MKLPRRWRKTNKLPRNVLVVDAQLIRSVVCDNLDFTIPGSLYDFVYDVDEETLNKLGGAILDDTDLWMCLTDTIVAYVTSLKFSEILDQGGVDDE